MLKALPLGRASSCCFMVGKHGLEPWTSTMSIYIQLRIASLRPCSLASECGLYAGLWLFSPTSCCSLVSPRFRSIGSTVAVQNNALS